MTCKKCGGMGIIAGAPGQGRTCDECDGIGFSPRQKTPGSLRKRISRRMKSFGNDCLSETVKQSLVLYSDIVAGADEQELVEFDARVYGKESGAMAQELREKAYLFKSLAIRSAFLLLADVMDGENEAGTELLALDERTFKQEKA